MTRQKGATAAPAPASLGSKSRVSGSIDVNILLAFIFGVVFLAIMLCFAIWFPNPPPFQLKVFMVALSTAAAGIGAVLPGRLNVEFKSTVRAGGALALFVIVWFSQPVLEQTVVTLEEPKQSADPVIAAFLLDLDKGDAFAAYAQLDQVTIDSMVPTPALWQQLYDANIKPLGMRESRTLMGVNSVTSPAGVPVGIYKTYSYLGKYSAINGCRAEVVTVRANQDKHWRVYSYLISPMTIACPPSTK